MPFNTETAKAAGEKSKRGPAKILPPSTKEKLSILYEGLLEDLITPVEGSKAPTP